MDVGSEERGWSVRLPVKEKAASLFAAGDIEGTQAVLIGHLDQTRGACHRSVWDMLFDFYWVRQQAESFQKLADLFVTHFHTSAPPWIESVREQTSSAQLRGRNALVVDSDLAQVRVDKLRDVVHQSRQLGWLRLDLSRATLSGPLDTRQEALDRWYAFMRRIRHHQVRVLLMGEYALLDELRAQVGQDLRDVPVAWHVLMEFLQWRGQEDAFEALATEYLDRFALSPPGYEEQAILAIQPQEAVRPSSPSHEDVDALVLPVEGQVSDVGDWMSAIEAAWASGQVARVDASKMHRMTFEAASLWAQELARRPSQGQVLLLHPTELLLTLLDVAGLSDRVQIQPRRR